MTKEEPERIKQGYQPIHSKNAGVIPPNTGSHVRMKENEYTWKDLDKAWWEGFDNAKNKMEKRIAELEEENAELKAKVGLSIDCEKAQKNGELCLGYGGDEDEPCERCKNCIKCEGGYYQLGETEKDEKLTKAKEIIAELIRFQPYIDREAMFHRIGNEWKRAIYEGIQFLKEVSE